MITVARSLTQDQITQLDYEIFESGNKLRVVREQLNGIVQQTPEWKAVELAAKALDLAKTKLKIELESDRDYTTLTEQQAELKLKQTDLKEIMSHHLIRLKIEEQIDGVPTSKGFERPVELKAKLGKERPDTLPMAFNSNVIDEIDTTLITPSGMEIEVKGKWPAKNRHQKTVA